MLIKKVGLYLLKNRYHASWVALACALLPFVGLVTGWISLIIVGLVTLRNGLKEGGFVLIWASLPAIVLSLLGNPALLIGVILVRGVAIWLLAVLLRRTASWALVMQAAAGVAVLGISILHGIIPDVSAWWLQQLAGYWEGVGRAFSLSVDSARAHELLLFISHMASGIVAVSLLGFDLLLLILARAWQAALFNPKGLQKELYQLHMGYTVSVVSIVCVVAALLGSALAIDILPVLVALYAASGLSLVHNKLASQKDIRLPLMVVLYFSLVLFLPYVALLLGAVGFVDSWYNFRNHSL